MFRLDRRPTKARNRTAFRPRVDSLEGRTVLSTTPINNQVLSYALSHIARKVGDGQCATLAQDAVAYGHGVPFYSLGPTGSNADYVWGKRVAVLNGRSINMAAIQPGDIIQFRNVSTTDTATFVASNGATQVDKWYNTYAHHTAIVEDVTSNGDIDLLEQNVNGVMIVREGTVWGFTHTYYTHPPGYRYVQVTHTFNGGTMLVYQPYAST